MRLVIVGASLAGLRAAHAARAQGFAGELTVIGAEPHPPYTRPPLSKQLLAGAQEPADVDLRSDALDVDWRLGVSATQLDRDAPVNVGKGRRFWLTGNGGKSAVVTFASTSASATDVEAG